MHACVCVCVCADVCVCVCIRTYTTAIIDYLLKGEGSVSSSISANVLLY